AGEVTRYQYQRVEGRRRRDLPACSRDQGGAGEDPRDGAERGMSAHEGPLVILSGPSGAGKSTVLKRLLEGGGLPLRLSVSATTRAPRGKERDGVEYHFWTRERF